MLDRRRRVWRHRGERYANCAIVEHDRYGGGKLTRFQINTKSVKVNMINILEDMVSEVIILRNSFFFPWQSVKIKPYC